MRTGSPKRPLTLTEDEQERVQSLAHRAQPAGAAGHRRQVAFPISEDAPGTTL